MLPFIATLFWVSLGFAQNYSCNPEIRQLDIVFQEINSEEEFYYCFGFHHGADRAWMMDHFRRTAEGRNAEVLGLDHLKSDLMMRLLNVSAVAERIWKDYPVQDRKKLELYSQGVNAGFRTGSGAKEFLDANYKPESWKPVDTIKVLLLQSFDQTRKTFVSDWEQEKFKAKWKDRAAVLMDNDNVPWENTILKPGEYTSGAPARSSQVSAPKGLSELWANFPAVFGEESGSNNWVVSSRKSATGKAMLANDPHLDLKTPLFWYWIHLKGADREVIGASLPGVPIVASGTNGKVAWGLTNAYINTADAAFVNDIPESEMESFRPVVWIRFWFLKIPFFFKSFERTKSGHPVLPLETPSEEKMFLRWTGFGLKASDLDPMFSLFSVKDVGELDLVLKKVGLPSWNFVFADTKGEIGYRAIGNIFRHTGATSFGVKRMSYAELKAYDLLTPEENPNVMRPGRDYVYSANNRHWPVDSALNGGRGYAFSFRGNRIDELLQTKQDVESFKSIQCDHQAVDAKYFVPKILAAIDVPELRDWNFMAREDSTATGIYRKLMDLMMQEWEVNEYGLYRLLSDVTEEMKTELKGMYSTALKETAGRKWGELHRLGFAHLSKNPAWNFAPDIAAHGDNHTVDPGTSKWNEDREVYEHMSGASMRMIIEMEERPRIHLVLPGFNRDYTTKQSKDPWTDWKSCKYTLYNL